MSSPKLTTVDSVWAPEEDDESDFGEFSSASPKSDGLAITASNPTTATSPSSALSTSKRLVRCTGVSSSCGKGARSREQNGYVSGRKIRSPDDCRDSKNNSQFTISDMCTGDVKTISGGVRECEICTGRSELCVASLESETLDACPITSCAGQHHSTVVQNCQSSSVCDNGAMHVCHAAEKSLNGVDGLSVLSGSTFIGSTQGDSGQAEIHPELSGCVIRQDLNCGSSRFVSDTELSSVPIDVRVQSEDSSSHETPFEFDEFQSVLHADDFEKRVEPMESWASFGNAGVRGDGDDSWLAFQDLESRTPDEPTTSPAVDLRLAIIPSSCADETGRTSANVSRSDLNKKKNVRKFLEAAYPTSANSPSCNRKNPSSISGLSCGSGIFRPGLLDLIGEGTVLSDDATVNTKHLSDSLSGASSSAAAVWKNLRVMEDTAALKFHWNGSHSNRLLLKSVAMESPTRLNARRLGKAPVAKAVQEIRDHRGPTTAAVTCRQPYESSFSQTVLSVAHLRM